ncbi:MAG: ABC transporter substrate-binding protein [Nostoc sp. ChiSLP02]|nr:ABC transporter substrate-binding protein [Nostoc sp. DedSLP05]MDZ8097853.1 ABC transporter substrate-binding protein [Nostoc sp. DedSLP01]MDZ8183938.1 ABC transporter substrate-binding protein [Nostoc sp. ChiSLP02]
MDKTTNFAEIEIIMSNSNARNPYIIGRPITEPNKFFGRESLFQYIQDCLIQGRKIILLHGQRRIGMSSILQQIPEQITHNDFEFVNFDLQDKSTWSLGEIISSLTTEIAEHLQLENEEGDLSDNIQENLEIFSNEFLTKIYKIIGNKNLVLMLDEFDVIDESNNVNIVERASNFFSYLKSLIDTQEKLFIILVLGRYQNDLENLQNFFGNVPYQKIGLLDEISARRLICKPTQGILNYDEDAIRAILELSAGHPYFTQVICFTIFVFARTENNWKITRADVEAIVDRAIESAEAGLSWFWDGLTISEKVILSAVVEAQNNSALKENSISKVLLLYGVVETDELKKGLQQLYEKDLLDGIQPKIKIEFIRRWLEKRHALKDEINELEKIKSEEIKQILHITNEHLQQETKQVVLNNHRQILAINPNHFSTIPLLAEEYLEIGNFDEAIKLYERTYKFDPIRNKESFLKALEGYGNSLIIQKDFNQAAEQFKKVLELEPDRISAKQKLREIEAEKEADKLNSSVLVKRENALNTINNEQVNQQLSFKKLESKDVNNQRELSVKKLEPKGVNGERQLLRGSAIIGLGLIGVALYQLLSIPCQTSESNRIGFCLATSENKVMENISSGERTIFPYVVKYFNPNRKRGIEDFSQGKYSEAIVFFKQYIDGNKDDPEALIYYNNALARQKGYPISFAVVVPGENSEVIATEILRGVAQAQDKFNTNGGLNGQLLEIVIANDANNPEQAKQVATELVKMKNQSILGVIGNSSNDTIKAALITYEKAGIATISPTSTGDLSPSKESQVLFRMTPSNAAIAKRLAEYIKNSLRLNKVVIFYNKSEDSKNLSEEFINYFDKLQGRVVQNIDFTEVEQDVDEEFNTVLQYQPQAALLFPNAQDKQQISVALDITKVNAGLVSDPKKNPKLQKLAILGETALYRPGTLKDGKEAVEGLILGVPWFSSAPETKVFVETAKQKWGKTVTWRTAMSYDATQALIKALSAKPSRSTILQNLRQINIKARDTSGYPLKFTEDGERQNKPILLKVEKGKFQLLPEAQKQQPQEKK